MLRYKISEREIIFRTLRFLAYSDQKSYYYPYTIRKIILKTCYNNDYRYINNIPASTILTIKGILQLLGINVEKRNGYVKAWVSLEDQRKLRNFLKLMR